MSQIDFDKNLIFLENICEKRKIKKRFKCLNTQNQRYYLFNPTTKIKIFK